ncbi:MAG: transporter substrate-binding domain-containing protein, partial [Patescibacteria group bacterium]
MRGRVPKFIVSSFIVLFAATFFVSVPPPARAVGEPLVVRVGLYDNKPKLWRDEKGVAQGLFPDILNAIAEMEEWKIEYVYGTWDESLHRLETNEIDLMPDVAVSDERKLKYDFNEETPLVSWGIFYTRVGVDLESMMDLEGKRIAALKSGILYNGPLGLKNLLDSFGIKAEIVDVKVYGDVFKLLDDGEADVGVVNQAFGIANEKDYAVRRTN